MDQGDREQKHQDVVLDHFNNKYHLLTSALKFFITVTLVSLLLCFFSGFSLFPQSYFIFKNTHVFSFLTHTLEKKYMFLICNGILAMLAKRRRSSSSSSTTTSVSCSSSPSGSDLGGELSTSNSSSADMKEESADDQKVLRHESIASLKDVVLVSEDEEEEQDEKEAEADEEEKEEEKDVLCMEKVEGETKGPLVLENGSKEERVYMVKQEEDAEEEANEELASTEELNRRFEEFIRKTKEELRIEAQQQLIAV